MEAPPGTLKKCPHCAELVQAEAIRCRYCGQLLDKPPPPTRNKGSVISGLGSLLAGAIVVAGSGLHWITTSPQFGFISRTTEHSAIPAILGAALLVVGVVRLAVRRSVVPTLIGGALAVGAIAAGVVGVSTTTDQVRRLRASLSLIVASVGPGPYLVIAGGVLALLATLMALVARRS